MSRIPFLVIPFPFVSSLVSITGMCTAICTEEERKKERSRQSKEEVYCYTKNYK
ncbi:hypothetical protein M422DRAFT_34878 [Sphaerobolus stellatus SS14]|uniref:Uncharacterized protein n=1 Tax=Sphaerobolus stellatus (strain SS14) TaxID=990650 RepID=A0A0C9VCD2_SPHS4|nr:hypothetical protein M422DRAFT_34878 [Sphaerobolus stellatus SS14]